MELTTVYHYCGMSSFFNIFKSKKFWMHDIQKMNDYKEMVILLDGFISILDEEFKKSPFEIKEFDIDCNMVLSIIKGLYKFWTYNLNVKDSMQYKIFIACFSENRDVLSQWSMYGDNACGVAIGFDFSSLQDFAHHTSNLIFQKVQYIDNIEKTNIQRQLANKYIQIFKEKLYVNIEKMLKSSTSYESAKYGLLFGDSGNLIDNNEYLKNSCFIDLLKESTKYKYECFKTEAEWRLIYYYDNVEESQIKDESNDNVDIEKNTYVSMNYRLTNNLLIKYITIPISRIISVSNSTACNDIVIGPKNYNTKNEIMDFIKSNGFYYNVLKSEIPFR